MLPLGQVLIQSTMVTMATATPGTVSLQAAHLAWYARSFTPILKGHMTQKQEPISLGYLEPLEKDCDHFVSKKCFPCERHVRGEDYTCIR